MGWAEKLDECDRLRGAYQDQQAVGLMTLGEPGSTLESLEETHRLARTELAALQARMTRTEELERDRDALLESWTDALPEALAGLTGQERNKVYKMLRLEVTPTADGFGVTGALAGLSCSIAVVSAVDPPVRPSASRVNRIGNGRRCGIV